MEFGAMMGLSLPHLLIVALVVLVLFGKGRISEMMGDFGKGIKSFKDGMNDDDKPAAAPVPPPRSRRPPPRLLRRPPRPPAKPAPASKARGGVRCSLISPLRNFC
jgi:sec-independent protein translocase protein TatA